MKPCRGWWERRKLYMGLAHGEQMADNAPESSRHTGSIRRPAVHLLGFGIDMIRVQVGGCGKAGVFGRGCRLVRVGGIVAALLPLPQLRGRSRSSHCGRLGLNPEGGNVLEQEATRNDCRRRQNRRSGRRRASGGRGVECGLLKYGLVSHTGSGHVNLLGGRDGADHR